LPPLTGKAACERRGIVCYQHNASWDAFDDVRPLFKRPALTGQLY